MKRKLALVICASVVSLMMCSCNSTNDSSKTDSQTSSALSDSSEQNTSSEQGANSELTLDDVLNAPVTDGSYFTYKERYNADGETDGITILSCTSEDEIIVLPETIDGNTVKGIDAGVFAYNATKARGIYVANTVEIIPEVAFSGIDNLEVLVLGTGVKVIEYGSIVLNDNLRIISILSDQLEELGKIMVSSCHSLEEIHFSGDCEIVEGIIGASNPTIYGPADSNIEKYAADEGLAFIAQ